jgi:hypothetical protein
MPYNVENDNDERRTGLVKMELEALFSLLTDRILTYCRFTAASLREDAYSR